MCHIIKDCHSNAKSESYGVPEIKWVKHDTYEWTEKVNEYLKTGAPGPIYGQRRVTEKIES